ncbi:DUF1911 domain-containing protein [Fibrella sp. HMF5335]|uniref:DUF1911 domain-containing protein n=1 Tax=Fibrella rubiginis TaxID=2817060 RepID=A0A939GFP0_9BACT|nr:PoNe immunity protein domain-containing protein [Fibrella rubiginis]MBO0935657.1 DUF1911 domain-containing protein [Fibrella rubiginis]
MKNIANKVIVWIKEKMNFFNKSSSPIEPAKQSATQTRLGVREPYFYKEYYDEVMIKLILFTENIEKQYRQLIAERGPEFDGFKTSEFMLADDRIIKLTIAYSRGDEISSLIPVYNQAVNHFIKSWQADYIYNHVLRIISLGWLLDQHGESLRRVAALLVREQFEDAVIGYMLRPIDSQITVPNQVMFPDDKGLVLLQSITQNTSQEAAIKLKNYLEEHWYTADNLSTRFNSHKKSSGGHIGYWSFEAGAITKIMGLDDSSFKDNPFYPYDLVHWQDGL